MSFKNKIKVCVIGATGYTGLDLILLLSKHPKVQILNLCASKNLGKKISYFDKRIKKKLPCISSVKSVNWNKVDLVFLSLPNGEAQKLINNTYHKFNHLKYIDLSADFRLTNANTYKKVYKQKHRAFKLIKSSIYSICEFNKKKIQKYRIISNPGCYPTSIQIPIIPLLKKGLIQFNNITIDSKSGYSGAGKNLEKKFSHKNIYESTYAYSVNYHRHMSEIDQEFAKITKKKILYSFNPHLVPTFRGIMSSIYLNTKRNISANQIRNELIKFYKKSKFIKILSLNSQIGTGEVLNSNNCIISICETRIKNKIIIFSAIDNLVKGASGQAVQNMNFLFDNDENLGLK